MIFADPGVEGLEWFVGSDLSQWELQLTGRRGGGQCLLDRSQDPPGLALSISPLWSPDAAVPLPSACVFDFYLAFPILEGHAQRPWLHTSFNRNRGDWVSTEEIRRWAEKGIQTVHCHNDGDYYDDGLFWRDGSYPPYPDMDRYDKVLTDCRQAGIRTATYFSNKELHPSTKEFQEHGEQWGRKNRKGDLQHNFYRPDHEFGAQMCLRSGWLEFLKFSIDRVLKNHPLDGVYYDWNVALLCCESAARGEPRPRRAGQGPLGHRRTAGPDGVDPQSRGPGRPGHRPQHDDSDVRHREFRRLRGGDGMGLPEMDRPGAGPARPAAGMVAGRRGSAGRHQLRRPRRQRPPAAPPALRHRGILGRRDPLAGQRGDLRAAAPVETSGRHRQSIGSPTGAIRRSPCRMPAVLRPSTAGPGRPICCWPTWRRTRARSPACCIPKKLPHPLANPASATRLAATAASAGSRVPRDASSLNVRQLVGEGLKITIPGDDAILIQIRE